MEEERDNKLFKEILEWSICTLIAIIIALLTRYYIGTPTIVKQASMYPTLQENQRIWVSRIKKITKSDYERGDIITFEAPSEIQKGNDVKISNPVAIYNYHPENLLQNFVYNVLELNKINYIKRIIGVEGDRIQIRDGNVYINGEIIKEEYLEKGTVTKTVYYNDIIVPKGYVFVMGDNRDESMDSRTFGCIPIEKIGGELKLRYWPLSKFGQI